jgi:hypothetical protein
MTTFETILCCILIPVSFVLVYIAGKNDLLGSISEMILYFTKELKARREMKESLAYPFFNDETKGLLDKAYEQGYLSGFDFSILMQNLLISKDGWVIDTGNYENVNAGVALRLEQKIKECPNLWKIFMVA